jgi:hypothetical protein
MLAGMRPEPARSASIVEPGTKNGAMVANVASKADRLRAISKLHANGMVSNVAS